MGINSRAALGGAILAGAGAMCAGAIVISAASLRKRASISFAGKVVLITGASRGLGLALAEEFGRRGARLALTARDGYELERARMQLLRKNAAQDIYVLPADLTQKNEAEQLIERTTMHFGKIDILVNNAGQIDVGPVENQTIENFREIMDANFFSGVHCTMSLLPHMLARRSGSIVNITSIGGKVAVPHLLPYTASKFAAVGFSQGLNAELRSKGISVTTVCPGLMRTGSHLNAVFTGNAAQEYRWFSLLASLPLVSASASSAARKIVRAVSAGSSEVTITPQAMLAARFANVAPALVARALQLMNVLLPAPVPGAASNYRGADVRALEIKPAVALGRSAARRYNQTT